MSLTVYVADGCPHCAALLADLEKRRVVFTLVNLTAHPERIAEVGIAAPERRLPVTVDHERCSVGFRGAASTFDELGLGEPASGRD